MYYSRGQETFFSRALWFIKSGSLLLILSTVLGLAIFCSLVVFLSSHDFLNTQKEIIAISKRLFAQEGLFQLPKIVDWFFHLTKLNLMKHKFELRSFAFLSIASGFLFFSLAFIFFYRKGATLTGERIKRGVRLISPFTFNREYGKIISNEIAELRRGVPIGMGSKYKANSFWGKPFSFSRGGLRVPEFALYRHVATVGATGVGKSTVIKWYLDYCRKNVEKIIIPDVNGEYTSEFFRQGDVVLSLYDKRSRYWSFETESEVNPSEFAKYLIPSQDDKNAFWWKGARQVLTHLLEKYKSAEQIWKAINQEGDDLVSSLDGLARKIAGKEGSPQAAGIAGSTLLDLGFLRHLNYWADILGATEPFSIFNWTQDKEPSWVFLVYSDSDREATMPLLKVWLNTAILGLLKRDLTKEYTPLNFVIDELTSLGKLELLPLALERSRKYRGKVFLGYQSEHQLMSLYGRETGSSIKANTGTKIIFRVSEPTEAREHSDLLGRQEVLKRQVGETFDALKHRENFSEHESIKSVVLDSEIQNLSDGEFFIKSLNVNPCRDATKKWISNYITKPHQAFHEYPKKIRLEDPQKRTDDIRRDEPVLSVPFHVKAPDLPLS